MAIACEGCKTKKILSIFTYPKKDGIATGFRIEPCEDLMTTVTNERLTYCIRIYHKNIRNKLTKNINKDMQDANKTLQ
jgi:hypothetical protein